MVEFKFLFISQDRHDHCIDIDSVYEEGESWQEALSKILNHYSDDALYEIHHIFRFEDGEFESCEAELSAENKRRAEKRQAEEEAKATILAKKKEAEEKALYLALKQKYG